MKLKMRELSCEEDYLRLRNFLREVFLENDRHETCWQPARLDYWRWHVLLNCLEIDSLAGLIFFWETNEGKIASVLNIESRGEVFLQVHPRYKTPELEAKMIEIAEERFPENNSLQIWAHEKDYLRTELMKGKGFSRGNPPERQHRKIIEGVELPESQPAAGYIIRSLGGREELPGRSWASWRAFHPGAPETDYEGWEWYLNIQKMPLYRRDLDLVAVSPEGELAGFCTIWFDDFTRAAYFEPVGVDPSHQRKGLGRALLTEGLRRLQKTGAVVATVGGYSQGANALYGSIMGDKFRHSFPWEKKYRLEEM